MPSHAKNEAPRLQDLQERRAKGALGAPEAIPQLRCGKSQGDQMVASKRIGGGHSR